MPKAEAKTEVTHQLRQNDDNRKDDFKNNYHYDDLQIKPLLAMMVPRTLDMTTKITNVMHINSK